MAGPLEGIRAVEWAGFGAGPLIGVILGDFGADVIKIEQRGVGEPLRGMRPTDVGGRQVPSGINPAVENTSRSKRSISLDLKKDKGKQIMYQLVKKADVFYTNFGQTRAKELGVDYEKLSRLNPRLVYANSTGMGAKGPYANKRAYDPAAQARSAMMMSLGERDTAPSSMIGAPVDTTAATLTAFGIVTALLARERTGIGQMTNTSLLHSAIWLQVLNIQTGLFRVGTRKHIGMRRRLRTKPENPMDHQPVQCRDGKWLMLAEPQFDRFWVEFCRIMGIRKPEYLNLNMQVLREGYNTEPLASFLDGLFATKPRDEWIKIFEENDARFGYAPVNEVDDLLYDPQVLSNNYFVDFDHPIAGPIKYVTTPIQFSKTPAKVKSSAPGYGQHTEEILLELDYSLDDIAKLKQEEVI